MEIININNTNYFLLKCNEGYLLIDAGWVGKYKDFKEALNKLNINVASIKYILITHHHHDHAALVHDLREEIKCKIIIHKDGINYVKNGITYTKDIKQFNILLKLLDKILSPFIQCNYSPISLNEDDIIVTEDNFDIYNLTGIKGKIIYTPGHSKDSISLVLRNGYAFIGDVAMNMLKIFGQKYRPIEAENYSEVYKSWEKLIRYGTKKIFPSHGKSFSIEKLEILLKQYNFSSTQPRYPPP
ncbi:MAG: MBL fold metallo-hydrolase [Candidatus Thorarchaeota archaeon]